MSNDAVLGWLDANHEHLVRDLADLVAVPSISTDGEHDAEIAPVGRADLRRRCAPPACRTSPS